MYMNHRKRKFGKDKYKSSEQFKMLLKYDRLPVEKKKMVREKRKRVRYFEGLQSRARAAL